MKQAGIIGVVAIAILVVLMFMDIRARAMEDSLTEIAHSISAPEPTPPPTPMPGTGYRGIITVASIPAQFEASDFPASVRTDAQTRHVVAPGCGSSASGTKLYYACLLYTSPSPRDS